MAPYSSAIKAWPSGQIMATPMITRRGGYPVRYAKPVAYARLAAFRRKRPIDGRAADQRYERAPIHSITSSARSSTLSGTVRPSALAVLRFFNSYSQQLAKLAATTWCKLTQARDCVPLQDIAGQLHSHSARKLLRHLLERAADVDRGQA
jgi:hypothetical protein